MADENKTLGGTAIKPEGWDRTGWEAFQYFLYNPKTGAILSRTPASWFKITVFYVIYYSMLALFWLACLQIFFLTLPDGRPKWLLDQSLVGSNPGVGLRPKMPDARVDSSLYVLDAGSEDMTPTNAKGEGDKNVDYAVRLQQFLGVYTNETYLSQLVDCTDEPNQMRGSDQKNCIFDISVLEHCGEYPYGYVVNRDTHNVAQPCFIIKLNKLLDWAPTPVNETKLDDPAYEKMSDNLKTRIKKAVNKNYVWIDCHGRFAADREAIRIDYFPANQGMALKYFPFKGGYYHQPLVAIKIHQTHSNADGNPFFGQLIHMECRAWFDGVEHSTKDKIGLVQFEVQLEPRS